VGLWYEDGKLTKVLEAGPPTRSPRAEAVVSAAAYGRVRSGGTVRRAGSNDQGPGDSQLPTRWPCG